MILLRFLCEVAPGPVLTSVSVFFGELTLGFVDPFSCMLLFIFLFSAIMSIIVFPFLFLGFLCCFSNFIN